MLYGVSDMMQVDQDSTRSRRRELRLDPDLDDALKGIAKRRGSTVSQLLREAALDYFGLSGADGTQVNQDTKEAAG